MHCIKPQSKKVSTALMGSMWNKRISNSPSNLIFDMAGMVKNQNSHCPTTSCFYCTSITISEIEMHLTWLKIDFKRWLVGECLDRVVLGIPVMRRLLQCV